MNSHLPEFPQLLWIMDFPKFDPSTFSWILWPTKYPSSDLSPSSIFKELLLVSFCCLSSPPTLAALIFFFFNCFLKHTLHTVFRIISLLHSWYTPASILNTSSSYWPVSQSLSLAFHVHPPPAIYTFSLRKTCAKSQMTGEVIRRGAREITQEN